MKAVLITLLILLTQLSFGQIRNDRFFSQFDYELAHYVGMEYNSIKAELGEPYIADIIDTTLMTRMHFYKVAVNEDSIDIQVHYDSDLICTAFSFLVDKTKYQNQIDELTKNYIESDKHFVTPNRYLVSLVERQDNLLFALYNTTIYPVILAQLNNIQNHLEKTSKNHSKYDLEKAEKGIEELYQTILAASTINNITEDELNLLIGIYQSYSDIINYDGIKISFIQDNSDLFFDIIPREIEALKHEAIEEVDFSEIPNLVQF